MTCPALETIAAWLLGELDSDETVRFEEHYFGCDACLARAERMERLIGEVATSLPLFLTETRRRRLEGERPGLPIVPVEPGGEGTIRLGPRAELMPDAPSATDVDTWLDGFLFSLAGPIYAGTNEIQRNVIAERVLGLPRK